LKTIGTDPANFTSHLCSRPVYECGGAHLAMRPVPTNPAI